ncbi:MAG: hypothetical protein AAFO83_00255 [Cyanobacteria bacterium J06607_13]
MPEIAQWRIFLAMVFVDAHTTHGHDLQHFRTMNTLIDTAILAVPIAAILHLTICFVAKYDVWLRNGRSFTAQMPSPKKDAANEVVVEVLPPDEPRLQLQQYTIKQLRKVATSFNKRLGLRHPNRIVKATYLPKDELIDALLPRFAALDLPA